MNKITDQLVRPYWRPPRRTVVSMFERACDEGDIRKAARAIHELAHRRKARAANLVEYLDERLLAKAFRGELVPQYPNDEPALVLLDRIRAQRASAAIGEA